MHEAASRCPPPMAGRTSALRRQRQEGLPMTLATFDRQEVGRFAREFEELFYRGDAAAMTSFYTQDAMSWRPTARRYRDSAPSRNSGTPRARRPSARG